jgi:hypothetical protein
MHKSNGLIERVNLNIEEMTRCALLEAGLPSCFLDFRYAMQLPLVQYQFDETGESPYYKRHGVHFKRHAIPFDWRIIKAT